jgi:flagellar hook-length control protein FliK
MLSPLPAAATSALPIVPPGPATAAAAASPASKGPDAAGEEAPAQPFAAVLDKASSQPGSHRRVVTPSQPVGRARGAPPSAEVDAGTAAFADAATPPAAGPDTLLPALARDAADPVGQDGRPQDLAAPTDTSPGIGALLAQLRVARPTPTDAAAAAGTANTCAGTDAAAGLAQARAEPDTGRIGTRRASTPTAADRTLGDTLGTGPTPLSRGADRAARTDPIEGPGTDFATRLATALTPQPAATGSESPTTPFAATLAAPLPAASGTAPPAEARLTASPGSQDFGHQLGAQLTTFVREGVEHARLQLHPSEMGPVSVQIQLDGQTAVVHLSAEHPGTRQALEEAMPLLAGSLREAGLTLTGGGVFEQPRQDRGPRSDGGGGGAPGSAVTRASQEPLPDRPAPGVAPLRRRGVVDLVA